MTAISSLLKVGTVLRIDVDEVSAFDKMSVKDFPLELEISFILPPNEDEPLLSG